jgi:uncharacterized lipoprotein YddW (UPF0748 family)
LISSEFFKKKIKTARKRISFWLWFGAILNIFVIECKKPEDEKTTVSVFLIFLSVSIIAVMPNPIRPNLNSVPYGWLRWPISTGLRQPGLSTEQQQLEVIRILDMHRELGMNAVILQIRPTADAFYPSALEPWSRYLTGEPGKAPDPYYDPLQFWIEECHKRGMELHAWLNPFRVALNHNQPLGRPYCFPAS